MARNRGKLTISIEYECGRAGIGGAIEEVRRFVGFENRAEQGEIRLKGTGRFELVGDDKLFVLDYDLRNGRVSRSGTIV